MIVISEGAGIVRRVAEYVDFFADSSCGQCPFCKIGSRRLSDLLRKIDTSRATHRTLDHLVNLCQALPGSGARRLGERSDDSGGKLAVPVPRRVSGASAPMTPIAARLRFQTKAAR